MTTTAWIIILILSVLIALRTGFAFGKSSGNFQGYVEGYKEEERSWSSLSPWEFHERQAEIHENLVRPPFILHLDPKTIRYDGKAIYISEHGNIKIKGDN